MVTRDVPAGERQRGGRLGPLWLALLVIGLGVWFLLDNLGVLPPDLARSFWRGLTRFWPVLLILAGLELLLRRRAGIGWLVVGAVVILLLGYFSPAEPPGPPASAGGPGFAPPGMAPAQVSKVPMPASGSGRVQIEHDAGNLRLRSTADPDVLLTATGHLPPDAGLNVSDQGDQVTITTSRGRERSGPFWPSFGGDRVDILLSQKAVFELALKLGATRSDIDLRSLQVRRLDVESGVGSTEIRLPATGQVQARVRGGMGSLQIEVPRGMAARIETRSGLGSVQVDKNRFTRQGDYYVTSDWDTATNRVDLSVEVGMGAIRIEG